MPHLSPKNSISYSETVSSGSRPTATLSSNQQTKGATVILNRTDYCKEVYRQLNNEEHYRQLPADPIKEHTNQL